MNHDAFGYVFDALDANSESRIEHDLENDAELRARVESARAVVGPLADDDSISPPPALAARTVAYVRGARQMADAADWSSSGTRIRMVDVVAAAAAVIILAALLLPAVASLRLQQSNRLACADRLRQLGVALAMYANHEGRQLPFVDSEGPMSYAGVFAVLLKSRRLIENADILVCPSADSALAVVPDKDAYLEAQSDPLRFKWLRRIMSGSYGYVLGFQEFGAHRGYFVGREDGQPLVADRPPRADEADSDNSPNHAGTGQNVLFAGGNVRWLTRPLLGTDDLFHNRIGKVGAGLNRFDSVIGVSEATPYPQVEL